MSNARELHSRRRAHRERGDRRDGPPQQPAYDGRDYVIASSRQQRQYQERGPALYQQMYGQTSVFASESQFGRSETLMSDGLYTARNEPASRGMPFSLPIRTSSRDRYWGGEENPELTTSYIDYATDSGPYGDLETLVGRSASPERRTYQPQQYARYDPDARYAIRSTRRERDGVSVLNDDIRSFDEDIDVSTSAQRSTYSRQRSGSEYDGTPTSRQSRHESQANVYINGNVHYQFARSQNGYRRRPREDDRR